MASLMQARDAINQAKDLNAGLDALTALMRSANDADAPQLADLAEVIEAVHYSMRDHLSAIERCIDK